LGGAGPPSPASGSPARPATESLCRSPWLMVVLPDEGRPVNQTVTPRSSRPRSDRATLASLRELPGPGVRSPEDGREARSAGGTPCSQAFLSTLITFSGNDLVDAEPKVPLDADDGGGFPPPSSPPRKLPHHPSE